MPGETSRPLRALRVLLADGQATDRRVVAHLLEQQGHRVTAVASRHEVEAALGLAAFDIVLMDLEAADIDAVATTAAIRTRETQTGRRVPVIAMTTHALPEERDRCLTLGMDDCLVKPIKAADLDHRLTRIAARR